MPTHPRSALILIVEDDPNDVHFLMRAFKKVDLQQDIRVAHDGQEAIEYLTGVGPYADRRRYPVPCLVILDLKLPRRNGLEVLEWLRKREEYADLPVCMVTSSDHDGDQAAAARYDVDCYRVKPVTFAQLVQLAAELRERAEQHCKDAAPCPEEDVSGTSR